MLWHCLHVLSLGTSLSSEMVGLLWLQTLSELAYHVPGSLRGHVVLFNIFSLFYSIYTQESEHITGVQLNTPVLHSPEVMKQKVSEVPCAPPHANYCPCL